MKHWLLPAIGLIGLAAFAACVGADPVAASPGRVDGAEPGTRGGDCYRNGSCDATLECRGGICVPLEEAAEAGGSDLDGGDGTDANADGEAGTTPVATCDAGFTPQEQSRALCPFPTNAASCSTNTGCCSKTAVNECASDPATCTGGDTFWRCTSKAQCNPAAVCCVSNGGALVSPASNPDACPGSVLDNVAETACVASCPSKIELCSSDADCAGALQCRQVSFTMGASPVVLGVCR